MIDLRQQLPPARSAPGFLAAEGRLILFGGVGDTGKEALNPERSQRVVRVLPTRFFSISEMGGLGSFRMDMKLRCLISRRCHTAKTQARTPPCSTVRGHVRGRPPNGSLDVAAEQGSCT